MPLLSHLMCWMHPRWGFLYSNVSLSLSVYQVVVEEERPRRARGGEAEILRCYPLPVHYHNASRLTSQYYYSAEFPSAGVSSPQPFTVGDNRTYGGYWNAPLLPHKSYSIYYQAVSTANGVHAFIPISVNQSSLTPDSERSV